MSKTQAEQILHGIQVFRDKVYTLTERAIHTVYSVPVNIGSNLWPDIFVLMMLSLRRAADSNGVVGIGLLLVRVALLLPLVVDVPSVPLRRKEGESFLRSCVCDSLCLRTKSYSYRGCEVVCVCVCVCVSYHLLSVRVIHIWRGKRKEAETGL